jgi:hypothetical protein
MIAVMMKPLGLFGAGEMARAIRPATKPMMMYQLAVWLTH